MHGLGWYRAQLDMRCTKEGNRKHTSLRTTARIRLGALAQPPETPLRRHGKDCQFVNGASSSVERTAFYENDHLKLYMPLQEC